MFQKGKGPEKKGVGKIGDYDTQRNHGQFIICLIFLGDNTMTFSTTFLRYLTVRLNHIKKQIQCPQE